MAERIRTDEERAARLEYLRKARDANTELAEAIPTKCIGCDEALIRAFVLADRVAKGETTLEEARSGFTGDTDECEGTIEKSDVWDAHPECWRKQQLGRTAILRGYRAFTD